MSTRHDKPFAFSSEGLTSSVHEVWYVELRKICDLHAKEWEKSGKIDVSSWKALGRIGVLDFAFKATLFSKTALLAYELGKLGYAGIRAAITVHGFMAAYYLDRSDNPLAAQVLSEARRGESILSLAISEPQGGGSLSILSTCLQKRPDGSWVINGCKTPVANASSANYFIILVGHQEKLGTLLASEIVLVPKNRSGVTITKLETLGWRAADCCAVKFENVSITEDDFIAPRYGGMRRLMDGLAAERLVAAIAFIGECRKLLSLTARLISMHRVGGKIVADLQSPRFDVARSWAQVSNLELAAEQVVNRMCAGNKLSLDTASSLKLLSSELLTTIATTSMRFHGARGYVTGTEIERIYRDAVASTIAAGASEILLEAVARSALRFSKDQNT